MTNLPSKLINSLEQAPDQSPSHRLGAPPPDAVPVTYHEEEGPLETSIDLNNMDDEPPGQLPVQFDHLPELDGDSSEDERPPKPDLTFSTVEDCLSRMNLKPDIVQEKSEASNGPRKFPMLPQCGGDMESDYLSSELESSSSFTSTSSGTAWSSGLTSSCESLNINMSNSGVKDKNMSEEEYLDQDDYCLGIPAHKTLQRRRSIGNTNINGVGNCLFSLCASELSSGTSIFGVEDAPGQAPDIAKKEVHVESSNDIHGQVDEEVADEVSDIVPDMIPEEVPDRIPDEIPDDAPNDLPEYVSGYVPENVPDEFPDVVPDAITDELPDEVPDVEFPDGVSEEVPEEVANEARDEPHDEAADGTEQATEQSFNVTEQVPERFPSVSERIKDLNDDISVVADRTKDTVCRRSRALTQVPDMLGHCQNDYVPDAAERPIEAVWKRSRERSKVLDMPEKSPKAPVESSNRLPKADDEVDKGQDKQVKNSDGQPKNPPIRAYQVAVAKRPSVLSRLKSTLKRTPKFVNAKENLIRVNPSILRFKQNSDKGYDQVQFIIMNTTDDNLAFKIKRPSNMFEVVPKIGRLSSHDVISVQVNLKKGGRVESQRLVMFVTPIFDTKLCGEKRLMKFFKHLPARDVKQIIRMRCLIAASVNKEDDKEPPAEEEDDHQDEFDDTTSLMENCSIMSSTTKSSWTSYASTTDSKQQLPEVKQLQKGSEQSVNGLPAGQPYFALLEGEDKNLECSHKEVTASKSELPQSDSRQFPSNVDKKDPEERKKSSSEPRLNERNSSKFDSDHDSKMNGDVGHAESEQSAQKHQFRNLNSEQLQQNTTEEKAVPSELGCELRLDLNNEDLDQNLEQSEPPNEPSKEGQESPNLISDQSDCGGMKPEETGQENLALETDVSNAGGTEFIENEQDATKYIEADNKTQDEVEKESVEISEEPSSARYTKLLDIFKKTEADAEAEFRRMAMRKIKPVETVKPRPAEVEENATRSEPYTKLRDIFCRRSAEYDRESARLDPYNRDRFRKAFADRSPRFYQSTTRRLNIVSMKGSYSKEKLGPSNSKTDAKHSETKLSKAASKEAKADLKQSKSDPKESKADPKESKADPKESKADPKQLSVDPTKSEADFNDTKGVKGVIAAIENCSKSGVKKSLPDVIREPPKARNEPQPQLDPSNTDKSQYPFREIKKEDTESSSNNNQANVSLELSDESQKLKITQDGPSHNYHKNQLSVPQEPQESHELQQEPAVSCKSQPEEKTLESQVLYEWEVKEPEKPHLSPRSQPEEPQVSHNSQPHEPDVSLNSQPHEPDVSPEPQQEEPQAPLELQTQEPQVPYDSQPYESYASRKAFQPYKSKRSRAARKLHDAQELQELLRSKECKEVARSKECQEEAKSKERKEVARSKEHQELATSKERKEVARSRERQEVARSKECQDVLRSKECEEANEIIRLPERKESEVSITTDVHGKFSDTVLEKSIQTHLEGTKSEINTDVLNKVSKPTLDIEKRSRNHSTVRRRSLVKKFEARVKRHVARMEKKSRDPDYAYSTMEDTETDPDTDFDEKWLPKPKQQFSDEGIQTEEVKDIPRTVSPVIPEVITPHFGSSLSPIPNSDSIKSQAGDFMGSDKNPYVNDEPLKLPPRPGPKGLACLSRIPTTIYRSSWSRPPVIPTIKNKGLSRMGTPFYEEKVKNMYELDRLEQPKVVEEPQVWEKPKVPEKLIEIEKPKEPERPRELMKPRVLKKYRKPEKPKKPDIPEVPEEPEEGAMGDQSPSRPSSPVSSQGCSSSSTSRAVSPDVINDQEFFDSKSDLRSMHNDEIDFHFSFPVHTDFIDLPYGDTILSSELIHQKLTKVKENKVKLTRMANELARGLLFILMWFLLLLASLFSSLSGLCWNQPSLLHQEQSYDFDWVTEYMFGTYPNEI